MEVLKELIRERLRSSPSVARAIGERPDLQDDPVALLRHLEERGLVEDIFTSLEVALQKEQPQTCGTVGSEVARTGRGGDVGASLSYHQSLRLPDRCQLCLRLQTGRAFLDFMEESDAAGRELQWYVTFGSQRLRSRIVPAAVDPTFDETFFLAMPVGGARAVLLTLSAPVHLVLVCRQAGANTEDPWDGPRSILCSHFLEWRHCLMTSGPLKLTVELLGVGRRHQLAVGVLHADFELLPKLSHSSLLPETAVIAHLKKEDLLRAETMRYVFEELDRWWEDHRAVCGTRRVRLFAQTENRLFLPLTSFVAPLESGRTLDSPSHALRWVSLIGSDGPSDNQEACWQTLSTFWALGRGTMEERAVLLCSLLLGFSLDAWCCLGMDAAGLPHAWVVVRDLGDASLPAQVTCWDVRAGARIGASEQAYLAAYSSIDVVFDDRDMYVCNKTSVVNLSFDFGDPRCWIPVPLRLSDESSAVLRIYPACAQPPFADLRPRCWSLPVELETLEEVVEHRLSENVRAQREVVGFSTKFDDHLAQLLHVAVANCEWERLGVSDSMPFSQMIERACSPGEVFHAVPVQFNHLQVSLYWPALSERASVRDLLAAPPPAVFALRCRVVVFPEGAIAVWVLLAVRAVSR